MKVNQQRLQEISRRIIDTVNPRRVIIFGSAATNNMSANSDLDLLVIMPDGIHRRQTAQNLYRVLAGTGLAKQSKI